MTAALAGVGLLVAAWLGAALVLERRGHRPLPEASTYDAIVVPGAAVRPDGRPSGALARRTDHALSLWRAGLAPKVCFTGGLGGHPPSEAASAAAYAREQGLPGDAIVLEDRSTSTEENAAEAARVLGPARIVVVTDSYHAFRCRRVFARHFPAVCVVTTRPPFGVAVRLALREVPVSLWYAATGRLARGGAR